MARRPTTTGRKKLPMEKMENKSSRQVTFSKRRQGLFKKASELVTLTGSEVLIVSFSPGGKVFSFAHPSPDEIIQRFNGEDPEPDTNKSRDLVEAHRSLKQSRVNFHLNQVKDLVDAEIRKGKEIDRIRRETEGSVLWERPIESLNEHELEFVKLKFKEFKDKLDEQVRLLRQERVSSGCVPYPSNELGGGGSNVGPVLDPKGKGIASGSPSGCVPQDPTVGGSSNWAPIDPMIDGFNDTTFGSVEPLHPSMHGFDVGAPYAFDPIVADSSGVAPADEIGMASTSFGGMSFDPNAPGPSASGDNWSFY